MFRLQNTLEHIWPACRRRLHLDNQIWIHILDHSNCETRDSAEYAATPVGWLQRPTMAIKLIGLHFDICLIKQYMHYRKTHAKRYYYCIPLKMTSNLNASQALQDQSGNLQPN